MADVVLEGAGFWLPAEFFADEDVDVLQGQEKLGKPDTGSDFCFPTEFLYDFHSGNRQHVEKAASWVMSTSPQSILAKLNSGDGVRPARNLGLVGLPRTPAHINASTRTPSPSIFQPTRAQPITAKQENPGGGMWYGPQEQVYFKRGKAAGRVDQAAWPVKQNPTRNIGLGNRTFLCGGSAAAKRECVGTGVFLPRVYGSSKENSCNACSSESHRKPVYPTSLLQERNGDPFFNNLENMKAALVQSLPRPQPQPETRSNGGLIRFVSDHDILMARRDSIMLQYQKGLLSEKQANGRANYHPQEWKW